MIAELVSLGRKDHLPQVRGKAPKLMVSGWKTFPREGVREVGVENSPVRGRASSLAPDVIWVCYPMDGEGWSRLSEEGGSWGRSPLPGQ